MSEKPEHLDERGNAHGHRLRAIEGRFHDLVWTCINCGERREKKQYYLNVECAAQADGI